LVEKLNTSEYWSVLWQSGSDKSDLHFEFEVAHNAHADDAQLSRRGEVQWMRSASPERWITRK
jgi:hypothetical protein